MKSVAASIGPTLPLSWIQNSAAVSVSVLPWTMVLVPELNQERSPGVVPSATLMTNDVVVARPELRLQRHLMMLGHHAPVEMVAPGRQRVVPDVLGQRVGV